MFDSFLIEMPLVNYVAKQGLLPQDHDTSEIKLKATNPEKNCGPLREKS
jgi:hypothetical protein